MNITDQIALHLKTTIALMGNHIRHPRKQTPWQSVKSLPSNPYMVFVSTSVGCKKTEQYIEFTDIDRHLRATEQKHRRTNHMQLHPRFNRCDLGRGIYGQSHTDLILMTLYQMIEPIDQDVPFQTDPKKCNNASLSLNGIT